MRKLLPGILFVVLLALLFNCCEKIRTLPPEPRIEFRQFTLKDSIHPDLGDVGKSGILEFYFEDGDGDIGLKQPGEGDADTVNLFFTLYRKLDGVFVEADTSEISKPGNFRIPYIEREGQNKTLQGTIQITLFYNISNLSDTIMYEFYITDRAGNESNLESTCEIPFALNGTYFPE